MQQNQNKFYLKLVGGKSFTISKWRIKLENNWAISIINGPYTYSSDNTYEVALINPNNEIDYTNSITNDVIGYCSLERICEIIKEVNKWTL